GNAKNDWLLGQKNTSPRDLVQSGFGLRYSRTMRSIASSSPRKANGAIIAPVLTPVTASNCGRANSPFTRPQPFSTPAPKAPQSPPPETIRRSSVGGVGLPAFAMVVLLCAR